MGHTMGLQHGMVECRLVGQLITMNQANNNKYTLTLTSEQPISVPHIYPVPLIPAIGTQIYVAAEATHRVRSVALHMYAKSLCCFAFMSCFQM